MKWFNDKKGFGFIEREGEKDLIVHHTAIIGEGFKSLSDGQGVRFEVEQTPKGPNAKKVEKIKIIKGSSLIKKDILFLGNAFSAFYEFSTFR